MLFRSKRGLLHKTENILHSYPFCWRCDTQLLYYAKVSWFIKVTQLKDKLLENNEQINWVPDTIKHGRFGDWLQNVKDWAISRERYWGTPLPIWACASCDHKVCIGSRDDLKAHAITKPAKDLDLHRPYIDEVQLKCPECGQPMSRVKEVIDVWFDSGAMPFAQWHYPFENLEKIQDESVSKDTHSGQAFPADYIAEAIDQTRGWFYTLLAVSTAVDKGASFHNVICLGHINDKFGKKMSKSKGNIIDPWQVIDQYGADAVRLHLYTINQPGEGKRYDLNDVRDVCRQNIMILNNVYKFFELYVDKNNLTSNIQYPTSDNVLDVWLMTRLNALITIMTTELEAYHVYEAARELPLFINDLSTWYVRRSRDRFKTDGQDKNQALATLGWTLENLARVMAPLLPFMAEQLWQQVSGWQFRNNNQSVHLTTWPQRSSVDQTVLAKMDLARRVVTLALAKRDEAKLKIRQPLNSLRVSNCDLSNDYLDLIKDEVNVMTVTVTAGEGELAVELDTTLTAELKTAGWERELIRLINGLRKEAGLRLGHRIVIYHTATGEVAQVLKHNRNILTATLADKIAAVKVLPPQAVSQEISLEAKFSVGIIKEG